MNYLVIPDISEVFEACDPAQRKARLAKIAGSVKSKGVVKPSDVTNRAKRVASVIRKFHPDIKKEAVDENSKFRVIKAPRKGMKDHVLASGKTTCSRCGKSKSGCSGYAVNGKIVDPMVCHDCLFPKNVEPTTRMFRKDIKKEAVDPESRDKRIGKLQRTYRKLDKYGNTPGEKASALYRGSKDKRAKLRKIISQHRIPGKIKGSDTAKVTFNPSAAYGSIKKNRKTVQGTANWLTGYMHNPGATMHVARKKTSGKTKWYKVNKG